MSAGKQRLDTAAVSRENCVWGHVACRRMWYSASAMTTCDRTSTAESARAAITDLLPVAMNAMNFARRRAMFTCARGVGAHGFSRCLPVRGWYGEAGVPRRGEARSSSLHHVGRLTTHDALKARATRGSASASAAASCSSAVSAFRSSSFSRTSGCIGEGERTRKSNGGGGRRLAAGCGLLPAEETLSRGRQGGWASHREADAHICCWRDSGRRGDAWLPLFALVRNVTGGPALLRRLLYSAVRV